MPLESNQSTPPVLPSATTQLSEEEANSLIQGTEGMIENYPEHKEELSYLLSQFTANKSKENKQKLCDKMDSIFMMDIEAIEKALQKQNPTAANQLHIARINFQFLKTDASRATFFETVERFQSQIDAVTASTVKKRKTYK